jgi:hypothetical protein
MKYHKPETEQIVAFAAISEAAAHFAKMLKDFVPPCADRTHALRCFRGARMWANAAIALKGKI